MQQKFMGEGQLPTWDLCLETWPIRFIWCFNRNWMNKKLLRLDLWKCVALTFIYRQLAMSWALARSCGELLRHLNQPACHLRMNGLSWLGFISLLSETHHLHAMWTQFNLGLEISSFFSPFMERILHKKEAVWLGGPWGRDHCTAWDGFSPLCRLWESRLDSRVPLRAWQQCLCAILMRVLAA